MRLVRPRSDRTRLDAHWAVRPRDLDDLPGVRGPPARGWDERRAPRGRDGL